MQCNVKCTVQRHIVGELERESQVRECDAACFQLPSFSFSSSVCEAKTKSVDLKRDESIFSLVVPFRPKTPCLPCTQIYVVIFPPSLKLLGAYNESLGYLNTI